MKEELSQLAEIQRNDIFTGHPSYYETSDCIDAIIEEPEQFEVLAVILENSIPEHREPGFSGIPLPLLRSDRRSDATGYSNKKQ